MRTRLAVRTQVIRYIFTALGVGGKQQFKNYGLLLLQLETVGELTDYMYARLNQ